MRGIEKLTHLTEDQKERLIYSANQYERFARIYFEVLDVKDKTVSIKIYQLENNLEKYLPAKELKERALEVFKGCIPEGWEINLIAKPYKFLNTITFESIREKQKELGLSDDELSLYLGIRKENLNRMLSGKRKLSKCQKVAFYYFFKWFESR
ncbi:hypothetical protein [Thermophagus xiamenensis]|uniref:Uncharacterized protein n=1 Tax=Thermophagus xiamenensis TaxID=385682 RepID=A0A1I1VQX3_9BACT|nr:hypothetical protein [Thermophagus xiamenensis]SFD85406.1 hypothetical protein SAMN05444380_10323 [Thermophagus xiamenensis]